MQFISENIGACLTAIIAVIGFVVWVVRMEGKVQLHDSEIEGIKKQQEKRIDELDAKLDKVYDKLSALSDRISELTGYFKRCEEEK